MSFGVTRTSRIAIFAARFKRKSEKGLTYKSNNHHVSAIAASQIVSNICSSCSTRFHQQSYYNSGISVQIVAWEAGVLTITCQS